MAYDVKIANLGFTQISMDTYKRKYKLWGKTGARNKTELFWIEKSRFDFHDLLNAVPFNINRTALFHLITRFSETVPARLYLRPDDVRHRIVTHRFQDDRFFARIYDQEIFLIYRFEDKESAVLFRLEQ